jgi:hypothetical protein
MSANSTPVFPTDKSIQGIRNLKWRPSKTCERRSQGFGRSTHSSALRSCISRSEVHSLCRGTLAQGESAQSQRRCGYVVRKLTVAKYCQDSGWGIKKSRPFFSVLPDRSHFVGWEVPGKFAVNSCFCAAFFSVASTFDGKRFMISFSEFPIYPATPHRLKLQRLLHEDQSVGESMRSTLGTGSQDIRSFHFHTTSRESGLTRATATNILNSTFFKP